MVHEKLESDDESSVIVPLNKQSSSSRSIRDGLSSVEGNTQKALDETGFGKFNYKTIAVAGLICANVSFSLTSVGFVLPSAACDFQMTTIDKGRLSNAPIFGMFCGSILWGCLSDTMGRRSPLLACLFIQAFSECVSSLINYYWIVLIAKGFSGFGGGGQIAILFTFMGEFQPTSHRLKALSCMEIFWIIGTIFSPTVAWITIPLIINFSYEQLFFNSRNLFMLICSLPSLISGIWLLSFPETPKFLAESGHRDHLMKVLTRIYQENTGKSAEEYMEQLRKCGIESAGQLVNEGNEASRNKNISKTLKNMFVQTQTLLKRPYLRRTVIVCGIMYSIMTSLFTLMLWFPELFERFANYEMNYPGETASVCIVSSSGNNTLNINYDFKKCDAHLDTSVFSHTLIVGLACMPIGILFPLVVNYVGFKFCLVFCLLSSAFITAGLFFVQTSMQNLILTCFFEALVSVSCTVTFCVAVEIFPTNLRATVSSLASLVGRGGAVIGNTIFSYLIDSYCMLLIYFVASELLVGGLLAMLLPKGHDKSNTRITTDPEMKKEYGTKSKYMKYSEMNQSENSR